jgi:hypothetical protein
MPLSRDHLCCGRQKERRSWRQFLPSSSITWMSARLEATSMCALDSQQAYSGVQASSPTSSCQTSNGQNSTILSNLSSRNCSPNLSSGGEPCAISSNSQPSAHTVAIGLTNDLRLVLGVKGKRRCLDVNQIDLNRRLSLTDGDLISEIITAYKSARGWVRLYFSVYQLRFCVFRKVNTLRLKQNKQLIATQ